MTLLIPNAYPENVFNF